MFPSAHEAELVIIDPQNIFASPDSGWCSPFFADALSTIRSLLPGFGYGTDKPRITLTRWLPTADRSGSAWRDYFEEFSFADVAPTDPLYDFVPDVAELFADQPVRQVEEPTFGKWGSQLSAALGQAHPHLVLTGVSTDCCVISTALAAVDAGCWVTVVTDGCAGSTAENHQAAVHVMGLYSPQLRLVTAQEILDELS